MNLSCARTRLCCQPWGVVENEAVKGCWWRQSLELWSLPLVSSAVPLTNDKEGPLIAPAHFLQKLFRVEPGSCIMTCLYLCRVTLGLICPLPRKRERTYKDSMRFCTEDSLGSETCCPKENSAWLQWGQKDL